MDEHVWAEIARVKAYADAHRYSLEACYACARGETPPAGCNPGHVLTVPVDYRVCYSIDSQMGIKPYFCHHLSVSVPEPGKLPSKVAVQMLVAAFGINRMIPDALIVYAEANPGRGEAVNIIFPLNDDDLN